MEESAFEMDCKNLLGAFVAADNTTYQGFCTEWLNHQFYYIFHGFSRTFELIEFTDMALPIVKRLFVRSTGFREQLGAFYLLYTLYFKQPAKEFTKIRIRQSDWEIMKDFLARLCQSDEYIQARVIFWKLIQVNALNFVATDEEHGFDAYLTKFDSESENEGELKKLEGDVKKDLMNFVGEKNGIASALQILEFGYNEMKEGLKDPKNDKLLPPSTCSAEILRGLRRINQIFNPEPAIEVISGDSRRKSLKRKALKGAKAKEASPEKKTPEKKIRTTMWKKMVQMNNDYLEITTPYRDTVKRYQSFANKLFNQTPEADCDIESEEEEDFSDIEEKILPDIN